MLKKYLYKIQLIYKYLNHALYQMVVFFTILILLSFTALCLFLNSDKVIADNSIPSALGNKEILLSRNEQLKNGLSTPTSLVSKDISGAYSASPDEIEVVSDRTENFKRFQVGNTNTYRTVGQISPIHYRLDPFDDAEYFKEIDLTIKKHLEGDGSIVDNDGNYAVENNGYQVKFWNLKTINNQDVSYIARFIRAGKYIEMAPISLVYENSKNERQLISNPVSGVTPQINNDEYNITWKDAFGAGLDFRYNVSPNLFFKTLIVNNQQALPTPEISTDGLKLKIIMSLKWDQKIKNSKKFAENFNESSLSANDLTTELNTELSSEDENKYKKSLSEEELSDTNNISFLDDNNRAIWWFRQPKAWDNSTEKNIYNLDQSMQRKGNSIFLEVSIDKTTIDSPLNQYPFYLDASISEEQVSASNNDARNWNSLDNGGSWPGDGNYNDTETTSKIGSDGSGETAGYYLFGARFTTVPIPEDAYIDSASLSLQSAQTASKSLDIDISAEDSDSSNAFASSTHEPYDAYLSKTSATYRYNPGATSYSDESWFQISGLSSVVAEVVGRTNWESDNAISFIIYNHDTTPQENLSVYTYDETGNVSGPKLNVSYTALYTPTLEFTIEGVSAEETHNGITTDVGSSFSEIQFGKLELSTPRYAAHKLTVTTNAVYGYSVFVKLDGYIQGIYPTNKIDPFGADGVSWSSPQLWSTPDGTTANSDTGWIGANTTDTRVNGWASGTSGKFGPLSSTAHEVMESEDADTGTTAYVSYAIEISEKQPPDVYSGTIIYNILPTY